MPDVVVTVPKTFRFGGKVGLDAWVAEGDLPGEEWSGNDSHFYLAGRAPHIEPGERVYVICEGKLRGYAPLVRIEWLGSRSYALVRQGGAVAVTIDREIRGFQGFRYRDWDRSEERLFPNWREK